MIATATMATDDNNQQLTMATLIATATLVAATKSIAAMTTAATTINVVYGQFLLSTKLALLIIDKGQNTVINGKMTE